MGVIRRDSTNLEGLSEYNIRWKDPVEGRGTFTAVMRVKDEAESLPWVLPGLFRSVGPVILIDNGSADGTPDVAKQVAKEHDAQDLLQIMEYPLSVGRCGPDHLAIPPNSVHSLTYYYNWAFSHVDTRYGLKWDGDMVLTEDGERYLRNLQWQLEAIEAIVRIPRYAVYIESESVAYLDAGLTNREPWAWPNRPEYFHGKALDWEIPVWPEDARYFRLPKWTCFEMKWLHLDEFGHWSDDTDFSATRRTGRKAREFEVFHGLAEGALIDDVHKIEAPPGVHVIDFLRTRECGEHVRASVVVEDAEGEDTHSLLDDSDDVEEQFDEEQD